MPSQPRADWYADPFARHERRYWDGRQWTEHVSTQSRQQVDPPIERAPVQAHSSSQPTAAWFPDPFARHERRYWDGHRWTEHVVTREHQGIDEPSWPVAQTGSSSSSTVLQQAHVSPAKDAGGDGTLLTEPVLVVNQKAKLLGSRVSYDIFDQRGRPLGAIQELRRDLSTTVSDRLRHRSEDRRAHRFQVVDTRGRPILALNRPAMGWLTTKARLVVEGPDGAPLGHVVLESWGTAGAIGEAAPGIAWLGIGGVAGMAAGLAIEGAMDKLGLADKGVGHVRFGLESGGQRLGSVHAENAAQWDFHVRDAAGTEIAHITKRWAGWAKERFTNADNYVVHMNGYVAEPLRTLVIASALAIDYELKQRGGQTSGSSLVGTRRYK